MQPEFRRTLPAKTDEAAGQSSSRLSRNATQKLVHGRLESCQIRNITFIKRRFEKRSRMFPNRTIGRDEAFPAERVHSR